MDKPQEREDGRPEGEEDDKQIWIEDDVSDGEGDDPEKPGEGGNEEHPREPPIPVRDQPAERPPPAPVGRDGSRARLLARLAAERPHLIPLIRKNEAVRTGRAPG